MVIFMMEKMGIYQRYNLGLQHYHSFIEFDFENKKVQIISQDITKDFRKDDALIVNDDFNLKIADSLLIPNKTFELTSEDCSKLHFEISKIQRGFDEDISGIWELNDLVFNEKGTYESGSEYNRSYHYANRYPKNWIKLGNLIIDIFGCDLLNVNLKNLITPLYYSITPDGVYNKQTKDKLKLKKLNFNISSFEEPFNSFVFSIDEKYDDFDKIVELLDDHGVYKWYDKDYTENICESDDFNDFKGNSWFIELIFENGKVLNLRGDNTFPDTYIHLGKEIKKFKNDLLKINEISDEKQDFIKSFGENKLAIKRNIIKKIEVSQSILLDKSFPYNFDFTLDCENSIIIPRDLIFEPSEKTFKGLSKINQYISRLFFENIVKDEIKLDKQEVDDFLEEFNKLLLVDGEVDGVVYEKEHYKNMIAVHTSIGKKYYHLTNNYVIWEKIGRLFEKLIGFDVFNIKNFKNIITPANYAICKYGVYDKETNQKLSLESIEYRHDAVILLCSEDYTIHIDFLNRTLSGSIEKDDLSDDEIEKILELLEKNHVYEWVYDKFWNKASYSPARLCDGCYWYLSLIFEGNRVLNIGDGNDYPDTFVNLAEDIIEFTNKDMLKLETIHGVELYKKYAKKHLND